MASDEGSALTDTVHDSIQSEDNQAGNNNQLPLTEKSKTFSFTSSGEFLVLRWLLRGLSLWHPRSSCCVGRYFYPGLISLLLAGTAIWILVGLFLEGDLSFYVPSWTKLFFVVLLASAWSSHLAGCVYFRSRDFEENLTFLALYERQLGEFRKEIKYYHLRMVLLLAFALAWLGGNFYRSYYQNHLLAWLAFPVNVYVTGMYLAVVWVIDILQLVSNARLRNQRYKFLNWTKGAEEAINDHICNYTTKVKKSCRRLRLWFLIHNVSLTILIPIVVLSNLLDVATLSLETVAKNGLYILLWAVPLHFAEQMERNDKRFCCKVNNFCREKLTTAMRNTALRETTALVALDGGQNEESCRDLTFVSRTEVQLLVAYLKNIRPGFLAVGYKFQLKVSVVAAVFSLSALVFKTNFGKDSELAVLINNTTSI